MERLPGVDLRIIPHLGIYDPSHYIILTIDKFEIGIKGQKIPVKLAKALLEIREIVDKANTVEYATITYNGKELPGNYPDEVNLNIIMHPYVYFNVRPGGDYKTTVKCGVYLPENDISKHGIQYPDKDGISINPAHILDSNLFVHYHPGDEDSLCFSPNNARIRVQTTMPLHIFYTLTLVPYADKFPRILIAKHVLILDDSAICQDALILSSDDRFDFRESVLLNLGNMLEANVSEENEVFDDLDGIIDMIFAGKENSNSVKKY